MGGSSGRNCARDVPSRRIMLIRALDFRSAINCVWNVGRKYVNHMAATEIMMAMAAGARGSIGRD